MSSDFLLEKVGLLYIRGAQFGFVVLKNKNDRNIEYSEQNLGNELKILSLLIFLPIAGIPNVKLDKQLIISAQSEMHSCKNEYI